MPGPLEPGQVRDQELAAPDGAVRPVTGAVEGHPDDRPAGPVVGQAGRDVRVVMLNAHELHAGQVRRARHLSVGELRRVLRGQVVRMQVVGHHLGRDVEQPPEVGDALGERAERLGVLQVPDVVRDERMIAPAEAERALQLGAAGEHRPGEPGRQVQRLRDVTAGPPDHGFAAPERPYHRVVGPDLDRPVVR